MRRMGRKQRSAVVVEERGELVGKRRGAARPTEYRKMTHERQSDEDGWASNGWWKNEWIYSGKDPAEQCAQGSDEAKPRIPRSTPNMAKKRSRPSRPQRRNSRERGSAAPPKNGTKVEVGGAQYLAVKGAKNLWDIISTLSMLMMMTGWVYEWRNKFRLL